MRRDVFQAIADPTRRKIIHTLAQRPLNLNSVAEKFNISRPAVSKHVKILTECGLITIKQTGRERHCTINFKSLKEVSDWIEQYRIFWTKKLDALGDFLEKENKTAKSLKFKTTKSNKKIKNSDMQTQPFIIERSYNAPVEKVWKALTDKDQMKQWYFDIGEFKPEVGFEFTFTGRSENKVYIHLCKVIEVIPNKKLKHSWNYKIMKHVLRNLGIV